MRHSRLLSYNLHKVFIYLVRLLKIWFLLWFLQVEWLFYLNSAVFKLSSVHPNVTYYHLHISQEELYVGSEDSLEVHSLTYSGKWCIQCCIKC